MVVTECFDLFLLLCHGYHFNNDVSSCQHIDVAVASTFLLYFAVLDNNISSPNMSSSFRYVALFVLVTDVSMSLK